MSNLLRLTGMTGATATAFTAALLVSLPFAPAHAQSGSRLCGYTAPGPDGAYVGMLYEARQSRVDYSQVCEEATSQLKDKIDKHSDLRNLDWTRHIKETCESLGVKFQSNDSPLDMCDKMEASVMYHVTLVPSPSGAATTYKKITVN